MSENIQEIPLWEEEYWETVADEALEKGGMELYEEAIKRAYNEKEKTDPQDL